MKLSIAVCTYNRADDLRACLAALDARGYHGSHEVIVVDNSDDASHHASNETAAGKHRGVTYLRSDPPGLSRARNVALAAATGEVIAYLDDDATPLDGWAEAVLAAFADADVVCAGGPILPEWEGQKPAWLGGELLLSLAVMDLGPRDRDLREDEFFFGANSAFRVGALRAVGGFAEHLGRTKTDLMGDEEIDVQRRLRAHGRSRHAGGARVLHHIHADRCSMQWFLKRYAWQGVSDARSADAGTLNWLATLVAPDELPGAAALRELLAGEPESMADAVARVRFTRGLVAALLNDRVPVTRSATPVAATRSLEAPEFESFKCQVPGDTEVLFVELGVAHSYLYGAYGDLPRSFLLNPSLDPGRQPQECAEFLRNALFFGRRAGVRSVVLLTGDVLTWPGYERVLDRRDPGIGVFGFIHRVPSDASSVARLRSVSKAVERLVVYADPVKTYLRDQHGLENVHVVPHPPVFMVNVPPRTPRDRVVAAAAIGSRVGLGMVGEVRKGKGYEFGVEALASASLAVRSRVKVIMAGAAEAQTGARLRARCAEASLVADLHLRDRTAQGYRAIPDNVFARALADCDVVAFPYEDDHRTVFSGHFVDALVSGACFLASADTVLGDLVERNGLGETFESGDARSFVAALERLLRQREGGAYSGADRSRLVAHYSTAAACRALREVLEAPAAATEATSAPASASSWRAAS